MKVKLLVLLALSGGEPLSGQKYEAGIQFAGIHLHKIQETPVGLGGRFDYNLSSHLAADVAVMHYPENSSGNFGETSAFFGIRAGWRQNRFGVFGQARPGVVHFGGDYFTLRMEQKTHWALDAGAVLEYYPGPRTFVRIDLSDTVIYYGSTRWLVRADAGGTLTGDALGTVHNFQPAFGFGFRF